MDMFVFSLTEFEIKPLNMTHAKDGVLFRNMITLMAKDLTNIGPGHFDTKGSSAIAHAGRPLSLA